MCGKFTQMAAWARVHEYAELFSAAVNDDVRVFTPMSAISVVHLNPSRDGRLVSPMVWGFTDRAVGRRIPKHMHARGESVHEKRTFAEAFEYRRGITWAHSFNEGREIDVLYDDGTPNGKKWTQQWTYTRKDKKPIIIGVIFDAFDVGRGTEFEFVQVTTPANAVISNVTDRMPLLLDPDDIALWIGEQSEPLEEVMKLIKTYEFNPDEWDARIEDPSKKPPRPKRPKAKKSEPEQSDLF